MATARALPAERTRLIGRDDAVARAEAAPERLVTVTGPPGAGKTRLAAHLARRQADGGAPVWWIDATGLRDEAALEAAAAAALGLPARGDVGRALAAAGDARIVVVGADQLDRAARERIAAWLDAAPSARALVAAIGRLGVEGEHVVEIGPLALPDAVALFQERAAAAGGHAGDPRDVEALVEQLDRLPLSIELAAARTTVLTPRQLATRLQSGQRVLHGGPHGSVSAAIGFAWDLLDPGEQRALAWCSVFRRGFDLEAAEAVLDDAVAALAGLRERSMLQREGDRFVLLETIRAHAAERLDRIGERQAAEERHLAHYLAAGEIRAAHTGADEDADALAWLATERHNLLAAFERAADAEAQGRLALVLYVVLALHGPVEQAAEVLDGALARARHATLRARLLRVRADVHLRNGRLDRARASLDEALSIEVPAVLRARVLADSGRLRSLLGDAEVARAELGEAIRALRDAREPFLEGIALNALGTAEQHAGDAEAAAAAFAAALERYRDAGSRRMEGIATTNLALLRADAGRLGDARDLLERATAVFAETRARADEASARINLGHLHLAAGRLDLAESALRAGLALEREVGKHDFEGIAVGNLALVAFERGELRAARSGLQEAIAQLRRMGHRQAVTAFLPFLAANAAALGDLAEARAALEEAAAFPAEPRQRDVQRVLAGFLDLASPGDPEERRRAAAARLEGGGSGADAQVARRLLQAALATFGGGAPAAPAEPAEGGLRIGPEAAWFEVEGARGDLARRGAHRRVLLALVEQRLLAPGAGLPVERLFAAGWPGERAVPEAASNRVYGVVRALRAMGLESVLLRNDDGYLLDPAVPVRRIR